MPRGLSVVLSVAILAVAAYFAWRLAFQPKEPPPKPVDVPGLAPDPGSAPRVPEPPAGLPEPSAAADGEPGAIPDGIEGVIRDARGDGVGDADVQIVAFVFDAASTRPPDRRFNEVVEQSTTSGADGSYSFRGLVPGDLKNVRVTKPGYVTQVKDSARVPARCDFRLEPGVAVSGRVLSDATGEPIQGVGVKGWYSIGEGAGEGFRWKEEVFTNALGAFRFDGAPAGRVRFMLAHPAFEDVDREHEIKAGVTNDLTFRMKPAINVEGVVLDARSGAPAASVDVAVFDHPLGLAPRWRARTDQDGAFRISGMHTGSIRFDFEGREYAAAREMRDIGASHDRRDGSGEILRFRILPAGRVSGLVTSADGRPVAGARIFVAPVQHFFQIVRDPRQHGGSAGEGETRSDANGRFLVDGLGGVPHIMVAEAPGFALGVSDPVSVEPGEIRDDVVIALPPPRVIRGIITDENRVPVAGALVSTTVPQCAAVTFPPGFDVGHARPTGVVTNEFGEYRFDLPYGGNFLLAVNHDEFVPVDGVEIALVEGEHEVVHDFEMKRAFAITGTVRAADGSPVRDAVVHAWTTEREAGRAVSGEDGGYRLPQLAAGAYRIQARKSDDGLVSAFRDDVPAPANGLDLVLGKAAEITGSVSDASGAPVTAFQIVLRPYFERVRERKRPAPQGLEESEHEVRDDGGAFRVQGVQPGRWTVQILAHGFAPSTPVDVTVAPDAVASAGRITLHRGGRVTGVVRGPEGPAAGVTVNLLRVGEIAGASIADHVPQKPWSGTTDASGAFDAPGRLPGEYRLYLESPELVVPPAEHFEVHEDETVRRSFTLRASASLNVVVRDEADQPVPNAFFTVEGANQQRVFIETEGSVGSTTNLRGELALKKLPAGEPVRLRVVAPGFIVRVIERTLAPGDNGRLEVRILRLH